MTISREKLRALRALVSKAAIRLHDEAPNRLKKRAETISETAAEASASNLSQMAAELLQVVQERRDEMIAGIVSSTGTDRSQAERALDTTSAGRTLEEIVGAMKAVLKALEGAGDVLGKRTGEVDESVGGVTKVVTQTMLDALRRTVAAQPASDQRDELLGVIDDADPRETDDRKFEQMITAARTLPTEKREMTEKHEFAKNGHLPDTYYDRFGNVRPDMAGAALDHLSKAHVAQTYDLTESASEKSFYAKVDALTAEGADFAGACAQVTSQEPDLAKRAFGH